MPVASLILALLSILFGILVIALPGLLRYTIGIYFILMGVLLLVP